MRTTKKSIEELSKQRKAHYRVKGSIIPNKQYDPFVFNRLDAPLPEEFDYFRCGKMIIVEDDDLTLRYMGGNRDGPSMSLSKYSVPIEACLVYFEAKILNDGQNRKGGISIGIAQESIMTYDAKVGQDEDTVGWQAESGSVHSGLASHPLCTYGKDDIVGCIVNIPDRILSFTKNGMLLAINVEIPFNLTDYPVFPAISLSSPGAYVIANFGQRPFLFDIKSYELSLREKGKRKIGKLLRKQTEGPVEGELPSNMLLHSQDVFNASAINRLICNQLLIWNCKETAELFKREASIPAMAAVDRDLKTMAVERPDISREKEKLMHFGAWLYLAELLRMRYPKQMEKCARLDAVLQKRLITQHIQDTHKDGDMEKIIRMVNKLCDHAEFHASDDEQISWSVYQQDTIATKPDEDYISRMFDRLKLESDVVGPLEFCLMQLLCCYGRLWLLDEITPPIMESILTHIAYDPNTTVVEVRNLLTALNSPT